MKRFIVTILFCVLSAFIIPFAVFYFMKLPDSHTELKKESSADEIKVYFHNENEVRVMNTEEYLCGVVAAEMPASFESEALKAQAVAARSYAYYRKNSPTPEHPDAAVCTDYTHCKAFKTKEEQRVGWGENTSVYTKKVKDAVYGTAGEVLTYNGEIAMTVFHSQAGGGRTENSKDVWGGDVPYLVSVESHGEEQAPNFYSTVKMTFNEFKDKLCTNNSNLQINSPLDIGSPIISEGGSVKTIKIGNIDFTGKELRQLFGLRSSCFRISLENNNIIFEVTGYGHGVGMSQYGANALAKEGYSYLDILKHYYTGTELNAV